MTRHAEMERPDEVQEAEFAHLVQRDYMEIRRAFRALLGIQHHRRPYSRLRERNVFDPTYRPRHLSHRAEGAAS